MFVVYYLMGGVVIDFDGCMLFFGFFVVGEVVWIGVYGVNCLVLNLFFEGVVFGVRVVVVFVLWIVYLFGL